VNVHICVGSDGLCALVLFVKSSLILKYHCGQFLYVKMYTNRCIRIHNWPCYNQYFCHVIRNYAFKSDLKIKWVRPPKVPCIKPEKSGDLASLPPVDKKQYPLEFQNSEELKT
jgi:hypothetical protein